MYQNIKEQAKTQRDMFFRGSKRSVYNNLRGMFYLEDYSHSMVSRIYLKMLSEGTIACPEKDYFRDTDGSLKIPKRMLCSLLLNSGKNFHIQIQSLPSISWMMAALRMHTPNHPLVTLADQAFDINQKFLLDQITSADFFAAKTQNTAEIILYVENERTTWQKAWKGFVSDKIVDYVADLIMENRHFVTTRELSEIMNL